MAEILVGLSALKTKLTSKLREIEEAAAEAVAEEAAAVHADVVKVAPRLTGNLDEHVTVEAKGLHATVASTSREAVFMEHGTFKDSAQPSMTPAKELARTRFPKRVEVAIREVT